ncbi:MAG: phosphoribosylglycinamide formyltransferase [Elusimicrobiota bacterium]|jgi:formyltetrahydrofolate-dependent phosphoribosylglycinamide formyltransferase|nr:phosphoribosylglycinamide formyltransferase [Elusimicrobiota bacterium]
MNKKIIVFASGGGSNFEALAKAAQSGDIKGQIVLLVAGKPAIGAIDKAAKYNIPVFVEGPGDLLSALKAAGPDLICLAGYLKKVPQNILDICPVMNIHPALLPKFGGKGMHGAHVHRAVLAAGEAESGATIHFIDADYDKGTIIAQAKVPVLPGDTPQTLAARVLEVEHKLYPQAVKIFCEGKL